MAVGRLRRRRSVDGFSHDEPTAQKPSCATSYVNPNGLPRRTITSARDLAICPRVIRDLPESDTSCRFPLSVRPQVTQNFNKLSDAIRADVSRRFICASGYIGASGLERQAADRRRAGPSSGMHARFAGELLSAVRGNGWLADARGRTSKSVPTIRPADPARERATKRKRPAPTKTLTSRANGRASTCETSSRSSPPAAPPCQPAD